MRSCREQLELAVRCHQTGDLPRAISLYGRVLAIDPTNFDALHLSGVATAELRETPRFERFFRWATKINPQQWNTYENLSIASSRNGRPDDAAFQAMAAIAVECQQPGPYLQAGKALALVSSHTRSLAFIDRSVALSPAFAEALLARGNLSMQLAEESRALDDYLRVIALWPNRPEGYANSGTSMQLLRLFKEAVAHLNRALLIDELVGGIRPALFMSQLYLCDWTDFDRTLSRVCDDIIESREVPPFLTVAVFDDPALQYLAAKTYSKRHRLDVCRHPEAERPVSKSVRIHSKRIKIAYLSADFQAHATSFLMAEMFEAHDRDRFEIYGVSFGPPSEDATRKRLISAFDHFIDVRTSSVIDIVERLRSFKIDIAIDLKGYTRGNRAEIFARGCANIQAAYLGFPGTTAIRAMDYVIADKSVISSGTEIFFTEKPVYLPASYQVNDSTRPLPRVTSTRADLGLPQNAFVFCSFNAPYKIQPDCFGGWMRILSAVHGSILWLIDESPTTCENLRRSAAKFGISGDRLIFAPRVSVTDHLDRLGHADLCLDTFPCNSHTTASDALWAGVPLLTRAGRSFASRVALSLLTALSLTELVTWSQEEFESTAIALARANTELAALRHRLASARKSTRLFDGRAFCNSLEKAFEIMHERYVVGKPPSMIDLTAR